MGGRLDSTLLVGALALALLNAFSTPAYAYGYLGSGYWPSSTVYVFNYGSAGYDTAAEYARSSWHYSTVINLISTSSGSENMAFQSRDYGDTGWYGQALICALGNCNNSTAFNSTYTYAEARMNRYPPYGVDGWSSQKKQAGFAHEIGHALSLKHNTGCGSCLMYPDIDVFYGDFGTYKPTTDEVNGINDRY